MNMNARFKLQLGDVVTYGGAPIEFRYNITGALDFHAKYFDIQRNQNFERWKNPDENYTLITDIFREEL